MQIITKTEAKNLKDLLPRGHAAILMQRTQLSRATISMVLNGKRYNETVIHEAVKLAIENQKQQRELKTMLQQVIEEKTGDENKSI